MEYWKSMMKSPRRLSNSKKAGGEDRLWAPWRISYIQAPKNDDANCIFCSAFKRKHHDQVLFTSRHSTAMLNIFPYNNGHLMVAPRRHLPDLSLLKESELLDLFKSVVTAQARLKKALKPDGFNIGINIGRAGGAGITGHLHVHIVPRWIGDTNFMPTVAGTKVISQSLEELLQILRTCTP